MERSTFVDQTTFGDGSDGQECGNCFSACIASMLGLGLGNGEGQVPNFMARQQAGGDHWFLQINEFLKSYGMRLLDMPMIDDQFPLLLHEGQMFIGSGPAIRNSEHVTHSVVMRIKKQLRDMESEASTYYHLVEYELIHDPNAIYRNGIVKLENVSLIVPMDPWVFIHCARGRGCNGNGDHWESKGDQSGIIKL